MAYIGVRVPITHDQRLLIKREEIMTENKKNIILQFGMRADLSVPWPVLIETDGTVLSGRPDAFTLIGFQEKADVQEVKLFTKNVTDLAEVIGTFPVYAGIDGNGLFVIREAVESAEYINAPREVYTEEQVLAQERNGML